MAKKKVASGRGRKRKLARDDKQEADVSPPKKKQKIKKQKGKKQKAKKDDWQPPIAHSYNPVTQRQGSPHVLNPVPVQGKWIYDDCDTVDAMIEALKGQITYLEGLKDHGWNTIERNGDDCVDILNEEEPRWPRYHEEGWF